MRNRKYLYCAAIIIFFAAFVPITSSVLAERVKHFNPIPMLAWNWIWTFLIGLVLCIDEIIHAVKEKVIKPDFVYLSTAIALIAAYFVLTRYYYVDLMIGNVLRITFWITFFRSMKKAEDR